MRLHNLRIIKRCISRLLHLPVVHGPEPEDYELNLALLVKHHLDIGDDLEILKEGETWRMLSRFWGKKYNVPAVLARANSIPYQARQYL